MQGIAGIRESLRQPNLCQRLMLTEMHLPDAAKAWSIFQTECSQALIQGTGGKRRYAAGLDVLRRKRRRSWWLRLAQHAGHVSLPNCRRLETCTGQSEAHLLARQWLEQNPDGSLFAVGERHRTVMHDVIEANRMRSEVHAARDSCGLELGGGRQDHRSQNAMIGKIPSLRHAVARLITDLLGRRLDPGPHQGMRAFGGSRRAREADRVFDPITLALERIGGQRNTPPRAVGMH